MNKQNTLAMDEDLLPFFDLAKTSEVSPYEQSIALAELKEIERRYHSPNTVNQGGMKYIYATQDANTKRQVAQAKIKNAKSASDIDAFIREAIIQAELEHPNIVSVYDLGVTQEGEPFFTMKLLGGCNLQEILDKLKQKDPQVIRDYPFDKLIEIFLKVCDAIAYAHSKNILHLDLKPANIQVDDYGQVQVCDWGLARRVEEIDSETENDQAISIEELSIGVTHKGIIKGSPGYMAPEQISSDIHNRSFQTDVYGLGSILYSILCLQAPIESDDVKECLKKTFQGQILQPIERNSYPVPIALNAVTMKALETTPQKRYKNVSTLSDDIRSYLKGFATGAENANVFKQLYLLSKRYQNFGILLLGLIIFGSITLSFVIYQLRVEHDLTLKARQEAARAQQELAVIKSQRQP